MDVLRGSGVTAAMREAAERGSAPANATTTLNPLAREFVIAAPPNATTPPLNLLAREFVVAAPPPNANPLNPDAREFLPWWRPGGGRELSADAPEFVMTAGSYLAYAPTVIGYPIGGYFGNGPFQPGSWRRRRTNNYSQQGRFRFSYRVRRTHKQEFVRRTIYVTNMDNIVTEEMLAELFGSCGIVVDCRICGDPTSSLRFAFIEFQYWEDACAAQHLDGFTVGHSPLKVMPSRTAIMPINPSFLPQSEEDKEMCTRTVYCTNIEKTVTQTELKDFCEEYFGSVSRVRLLGGDNHPTAVAFVEFTEYSGAAAALNSTGLYARGLLIRVSPSKTPIRTFSNDKQRHEN